MSTELAEVLEELARAKGNLAYIKAKNEAIGFTNRLVQNKYLYFIGCGDVVKVGVSSDPNARLEILATGAAGKLELIAMIPRAGNLEAKCHKRLAHLHIHGEWFRHTSEIDILIKELSK